MVSGSSYLPVASWIFLRTFSEGPCIKYSVTCSWRNNKLLMMIIKYSSCIAGPGYSKLTMSLVTVKFSEVIFSNMPIFFVEKKNVRSFCSAKASLIFSTKISVYLVIKS